MDRRMVTGMEVSSFAPPVSEADRRRCRADAAVEVDEEPEDREDCGEDVRE